MVFCNKMVNLKIIGFKEGHNPYFNRWFSAIYHNAEEDVLEISHNPYFNRWFSAISI